MTPEERARILKESIEKLKIRGQFTKEERVENLTEEQLFLLRHTLRKKVLDYDPTAFKKRLTADHLGNPVFKNPPTEAEKAEKARKREINKKIKQLKIKAQQEALNRDALKRVQKFSVIPPGFKPSD